jgi:hypothetical protein
MNLMARASKFPITLFSNDVTGDTHTHREREREICLYCIYKKKKESVSRSLSSLLGFHILYLIQQQALLEIAVSNQSPSQDQKRMSPRSEWAYVNASKKRTVSTYFRYIVFQSHTKFVFIPTQAIEIKFVDIMLTEIKTIETLPLSPPNLPKYSSMQFHRIVQPCSHPCSQIVVHIRQMYPSRYPQAFSCSNWSLFCFQSLIGYTHIRIPWKT